MDLGGTVVAGATLAQLGGEVDAAVESRGWVHVLAVVGGMPLRAGDAGALLARVPAAAGSEWAPRGGEEAGGGDSERARALMLGGEYAVSWGFLDAALDAVCAHAAGGDGARPAQPHTPPLTEGSEGGGCDGAKDGGGGDGDGDCGGPTTSETVEEDYVVVAAPVPAGGGATLEGWPARRGKARRRRGRGERR